MKLLMMNDSDLLKIHDKNYWLMNDEWLNSSRRFIEDSWLSMRFIEDEWIKLLNMKVDDER